MKFQVWTKRFLQLVTFCGATRGKHPTSVSNTFHPRVKTINNRRTFPLIIYRTWGKVFYHVMWEKPDSKLQHFTQGWRARLWEFIERWMYPSSWFRTPTHSKRRGITQQCLLVVFALRLLCFDSAHERLLMTPTVGKTRAVIIPDIISGWTLTTPAAIPLIATYQNHLH